ncbi:hypothetical protein CJ739_259 [Mariniflexile rhizosphaerae]|nr:hypothetical protein CJ739_259 [Mariniflexile sp. TRM1-10]
MDTNHFNICPSCTHVKYCVLTTQKSQVWECSEYDEITTRKNSFIQLEINQIHKS